MTRTPRQQEPGGGMWRYFRVWDLVLGSAVALALGTGLTAAGLLPLPAAVGCVIAAFLLSLAIEMVLRDREDRRRS